MSKHNEVHKCECLIKALLVDGDTDTVYCRNCEGVVGSFDDFTVGESGLEYTKPIKATDFMRANGVTVVEVDGGQ